MRTEWARPSPTLRSWWGVRPATLATSEPWRLHGGGRLGGATPGAVRAGRPGLSPLRVPRGDDQGPRPRLRAQPGEPVPLLRLEGGAGDLPRAPAPDGLGQHVGRPDDRPARAAGAAARPVAGGAPELPARACDWPTRSPGAPRTTGAHARTFREGEAVFARLVAASAPGMSRAEATRVARDALSAMVGSAVVGLDPEPEAADPRARGRGPAGGPRARRMSSRSGSTRRWSEPNRPPDRFGTRPP